MTVQTLISGFNKFDNCSYLLSSSFRSAFVSVARFSITFGFPKTLYVTVLFLSSYVHSDTTLRSKNSRFAVSKMQMHDYEKRKGE